MKILLSLYACLPDAGSEEGSGWNTLLHYAQAGFEIWAVTRERNREQVEAGLKRAGLDNIRMEYVGLAPWQEKLCGLQEAGMYLHYYWWQQKAARHAQILDSGQNFDLVHHVTYGSLQQGTGLWRLNKPLVFGPVGGGQFTPDVFKNYFYKDWFKQELVRRWISRLLVRQANVRRTLRQASLVYVSNVETFRLARRLGAKNIRQFHDSGLPADFYPDQLPQRMPRRTLRLLWVGRLYARKGLPLVLEALAHVDSSFDFHLTIVGDGPLSGQVPGWIQQHGLQGKVTCTGRIPWMEVREMYRLNDVFMFCSLRDSGAMQFVEAMAWGLPVITLDMHGGRATVPDEAGIRVPVEGHALDDIVWDLARAVEKLCRDRQLVDKQGRAAYEHAKLYSWDNRMARHFGQIDKLLGRQPNSRPAEPNSQPAERKAEDSPAAF